jgi:hypothetical protein
MSEWLDLFVSGDVGYSVVSPETALLVLLLAFCVGHVIGWVYMITHIGLSYSQMFVASLAVIPAIVALVMALMAGDIIIAVGLLAVVGVVRFRNVLKDTRDTTFILWAIVEGMSVGTLRFSTALIGTVCVSAIFLYLRYTSFGLRHRYDVIVSLQLVRADAGLALREILRRYSMRVQLAGQRELPNHWQDLSYRLLLRDPGRSHELLGELEHTEGLAKVSLYHRADESEM